MKPRRRDGARSTEFVPATNFFRQAALLAQPARDVARYWAEEHWMPDSSVRVAVGNGLTTRDRRVLRVLWIVLLLNWAVALVKITVGFLTGRLTVIGDGFHSLLDGANNIVGIVAITLSARPPDEDHPYGHRKFENIAAMMIGGMIVLMAWELTGNIVRRTWGHLTGTIDELVGTEPVGLLFVALVAATLLVNVAVAVFETRLGRRLASPFLLADSKHTISDTFVTGLSLVSLLAGRLAWWLDPLLAAGVLVFLGHAAWTIIRHNLSAFTDRQFLDPSVVARVVNRVEGVRASRRIRSHGTPNDIHLDLRITVSDALSGREVEEIERAVRRALAEEFPNLSLIAIQHETEAASASRPG